MVGPSLAGGRLMAVETVDAFLRVAAELVFVNNRILLLAVAFGTFARRPHERGRGLIRLERWPGAIQQERTDDQSERHDDGDEHRSKRHACRE